MDNWFAGVANGTCAKNCLFISPSALLCAPTSLNSCFLWRHRPHRLSRHTFSMSKKIIMNGYLIGEAWSHRQIKHTVHMFTREHPCTSPLETLWKNFRFRLIIQKWFLIEKLITHVSLICFIINWNVNYSYLVPYQFIRGWLFLWLSLNQQFTVSFIINCFLNKHVIFCSLLLKYMSVCTLCR